MAHDRSRSAFDVRVPKHWSSVLAQQGRLLSDDDWNEADAIDKEELRRTRVDVVGPSGSPDSGFAVTAPRLNGQAIDFDVLPGTLYVGGLRVTLEDRETFSQQEDWLQQPPTERPPLTGPERIDAVYLEVWQQPVTAVEDTELVEVGLGGPDTSVRLRTMRRVKLLPNVGTESCSAAWAALRTKLGGLTPENELAPGGALTVSYVPNAGPGDDLCSPSRQDGYLGAENQAIRVEIGSDGKSLLWGFDNASPLYRVRVEQVSGHQVIRFLTPPRDEAHWPRTHQVVELLPWSSVLPNGEKVAETGSGFLTRVAAAYDPDTETIRPADDVPATFGTQWTSRADAGPLGKDMFFYLRVWDRGSDTTSAPQIPFTVGTPVQLAGTGLRVTMSGTPFRPADHWILAVRPDSADELVPWRLRTGMTAEGPRRYYTLLGLIHWRAAGSQIALDCRDTFVPLTGRRGCCVMLTAAMNWQRTLDDLVGADDICVCFGPGDFTTTRTLEFRNRRVRIHGAGAASRLTGKGVQTVLRFVGCESVAVSGLTVRSDAVTGANIVPREIGGALSSVDCDQVTLHGVRARCAPGPVPAAAALSLYTSFTGRRAAMSSARVTGCDLVAGANQTGLQIVNYGRTTVADNTIGVDPVENARFAREWLKDKRFRHLFRRSLIYRYGLVNDPRGQPRPADAVTLGVGDVAIWLQTEPVLAAEWKRSVTWRRFPARRGDYLAMGDFLYDLAESLLLGGGTVGTHTSPGFRSFIDQLFTVTTGDGIRMVARRGIVVGGTTATDVRITGNSVSNVVQGIHVGVSAHRTRNPTPEGAVQTPSDTAGRVVISENTVRVVLMPESAVERHGIFVGNTTSLLVEGNFITCEKVFTARRLRIEGIRVYGFYGPSALVSRNHLEDFDIGVRAAALNNVSAGPSSLWRVSDTIAVGAGAAVDRSLRTGQSSFVESVGNKP